MRRSSVLLCSALVATIGLVPIGVDADREARVLRLTFHLTRAIATADAPPCWTEAGHQAFLRVGDSD